MNVFRVTKSFVLFGIAAFMLQCGCKTHDVITLTPFEKQVRKKSPFCWFLDISIIRKSLVVRDTSDKNACQLAFIFDTSFGTQFAHWVIYEPNKIVVMVEMCPSAETLLPLAENDQAFFIKIPDRRGRPVFLADDRNERLVQDTSLYTERTLPESLFPKRWDSSCDDLFGD